MIKKYGVMPVLAAIFVTHSTFGDLFNPRNVINESCEIGWDGSPKPNCPNCHKHNPVSQKEKDVQPVVPPIVIPGVRIDATMQNTHKEPNTTTEDEIFKELASKPDDDDQTRMSINFTDEAKHQHLEVMLDPEETKSLAPALKWVAGGVTVLGIGLFVARWYVHNKNK